MERGIHSISTPQSYLIRFIKFAMKSASKSLINPEVIHFYSGGNSLQRKTVSIQESIPVEIYNKLLDFGNGEVKDGIQNAVDLAYTMEVIQKSQMDEAIEIWRRMFNYKAR